MNTKSNEFESVLTALKETSKGKLNYDRNWKEERRTQDIINEVKLKTSSITVSPKGLQNETQNKNKNCVKKYKIIESLNEFKNHTKSEDKESNDQKSDKSLTNIKLESINEMVLINYEKQRQELVSNELNKKFKNLENEIRKCNEESEEELKLIRQKYALDAIRRINILADDYKALIESVYLSQISSDDNSMSACFKLKEIESKHQLLVEEQHKKQNDLRRKQLSVIRDDIDLIVKSVVQMSNTLETELKTDQYFHTLKQEIHCLMSLLQNIDILLTKHELTELDLSNALNIKLEVNQIKQKIISDINRIKENQKSINTKSSGLEITSTSVTSSENSANHVNDSLSEFVDFPAFKEYLNLQKVSNVFENSFKSFITENKFKQKKNELQLFVKTTINTISSESVDHIRDKLNRLTTLFNQKYVEYGGKQVNCIEKDGSLHFCISLASKMFVSVSTKQKDIALTMAPIVVLLWYRFPKFGEIFLANLQEKCPYVVPYYPKPDSDESEVNYLIACGYSIARDGTQENEESFLNRMRAMIKLFAAIIQSNVDHNHPYGLRYGWNWISRLLNLEPRPAITAAILEAFLSITSHKFYRYYKKQFIKIVYFIANDYIKRIESITQKDTKRQSLVKLSMFITDLKKKIDRKVNYKELIPEGVIPDYFFQRSYSYSLGTQSY